MTTTSQKELGSGQKISSRGNMTMGRVPPLAAVSHGASAKAKFYNRGNREPNKQNLVTMKQCGLCEVTNRVLRVVRINTCTTGTSIAAHLYKRTLPVRRSITLPCLAAGYDQFYSPHKSGHIRTTFTNTCLFSRDFIVEPRCHFSNDSQYRFSPGSTICGVIDRPHTYDLSHHYICTDPHVSQTLPMER
jgi:hypothetical protein